MNSNCRHKFFWFALSLLICLSAGTAYAEDPQEGYEAVDGNMMQAGETIPGGRMAAVAYGFVFVAIAIYGATLTLKTARLQHEVELLKQKMK